MIINKLIKLNDLIFQMEKIFSALIVFLMLIFLSMEVFGRELFLNSFPWASKLSVYLMIYLGLVGGSIACYKKMHLAPDFGVKIGLKYYPKIFVILKNTISSLLLFFLSTLAYQYLKETYEFQDSTLVFDIPLVYFQYGFFYVFVISAFRHLLYLFMELRDLKDGKSIL